MDLKKVDYGDYLTVLVGDIKFMSRVMQQITDEKVAKELNVPVGSWYLANKFQGQVVIATPENTVAIKHTPGGRELRQAFIEETLHGGG